MQIEKLDGFKLTLSSTERNEVVGWITFIVGTLDEELHTRTGFSGLEYEFLSTLIKKNSNQEFLLEEKWILMLHQILNELINGIGITNIKADFAVDSDKMQMAFKKLEEALK